tara:strand:+ start:111 stop:1049 length:939 start_codon:yes stop_codon:yes gene_type:complete
MSTAKRLVLLLLTGMVTASVACGGSSKSATISEKDIEATVEARIQAEKNEELVQERMAEVEEELEKSEHQVQLALFIRQLQEEFPSTMAPLYELDYNPTIINFQGEQHPSHKLMKDWLLECYVESTKKQEMTIADCHEDLYLQVPLAKEGEGVKVFKQDWGHLESYSAKYLIGSSTRRAECSIYKDSRGAQSHYEHVSKLKLKEYSSQKHHPSNLGEVGIGDESDLLKILVTNVGATDPESNLENINGLILYTTFYSHNVGCSLLAIYDARGLSSLEPIDIVTKGHVDNAKAFNQMLEDNKDATSPQEALSR